MDLIKRGGGHLIRHCFTNTVEPPIVLLRNSAILVNKNLDLVSIYVLTSFVVQWNPQ